MNVSQDRMRDFALHSVALLDHELCDLLSHLILLHIFLASLTCLLASCTPLNLVQLGLLGRLFLILLLLFHPLNRLVMLRALLQDSLVNNKLRH